MKPAVVRLKVLNKPSPGSPKGLDHPGDGPLSTLPNASFRHTLAATFDELLRLSLVVPQTPHP